MGRVLARRVLQVTKLARVPQSVKQTIFAFLATDEELRQPQLEVSAPQANAYEFQSLQQRTHHYGGITVKTPRRTPRSHTSSPS